MTRSYSGLRLLLSTWSLIRSCQSVMCQSNRGRLFTTHWDLFILTVRPHGKQNLILDAHVCPGRLALKTTHSRQNYTQYFTSFLKPSAKLFRFTWSLLHLTQNVSHCTRSLRDIFHIPFGYYAILLGTVHPPWKTQPLT